MLALASDPFGVAVLTEQDSRLHRERTPFVATVGASLIVAVFGFVSGGDFHENDTTI